MEGVRGRWTSGEWAGQDWATDYRVQWLGELLVERATVSRLASAAACPSTGDFPNWPEPGLVLVRFWLLPDDHVIDKAFGNQGEVLGYYIPVTKPLERIGDIVVAQTLYLGMRVDAGRRITVTGEHCFDSAVARDELTPVENEHAEHRIRDMTLAAAANLLPSAFVRNFTILKESTQ